MSFLRLPITERRYIQIFYGIETLNKNDMKTPMEIFKKHGAHYYENDEQAIIDAMTEYAEQQVKNLNIPDVSNSVFDCPVCGSEWDADKHNSCKCGAYIGKH